MISPGGNVPYPASTRAKKTQTGAALASAPTVFELDVVNVNLVILSAAKNLLLAALSWQILRTPSSG